MERRLAAVLCADVAGFSRLVDQAEESTLARLSEQRRSIIDPAAERHRGRLFKVMGDGLLLEFASAVDAVRCAIEWQAGVARAELDRAAGQRLVWRMAVHLGDVVVDGSDLVGDGVNVAARLQALAPVGGVLVSSMVRDHLKSDVQLRPAGSHRLKNISRPVEVFEVLSSEGSCAAGKRSRLVSLARPTWALSAALILIATLALGWIGYERWTPGGSHGALQGGRPTILVLPIRAEEEGGRGKLLADGLTDELINGLTRFSTVQVFGRNTSDALSSASADVRTLRDQHGVSYVLRGAMHAAGDKLRLNVELVDADTGVARWTERYEDDLSRAFQTLDKVIGNVVSNVAVRVSRAALERSRQQTPANLSAFELTLRGRQLWQRPNREALLEARSLFLKAAEADPDYAPPLAYAAFTHLTAFNNTWSDEYAQPAALERMTELANRALEIDPTYATAYAAQAIAYTYRGRHDEADAAAASALSNNPNDPDVLGRIGQVLSFSGQHREAVTTLKRAIALDPFGPAQWFNFLSRAHFFLGEDNAAITAARTCLERTKLQPCEETLISALALSSQIEPAALAWKEITMRRPQARPDTLVARLRPAFRKQNDIDRLLTGLEMAAQRAAQL